MFVLAYQYCKVVSSSTIVVNSLLHYRLNGNISILTYYGGDHGELNQLHDKLNCTTVIQTPRNDFNVCEDFLEIITCSLIISSTLATLNLETTNDTPGTDVLPEAESLQDMPDTERH